MRGVASEVRLGQAEAADDLAGRHLRQPLLLLLFGAELPDREHGKGSLHRHRAPEAAVAGFHLQARQPVADGVRARAAVSLQVHAEEAEARQLLVDLARELAALEPLLDAGHHPFLDELSDGVPDHPLLVGQERVELEEVRRFGRRLAARLRFDPCFGFGLRHRRHFIRAPVDGLSFLSSSTNGG